MRLERPGGYELTKQPLNGMRFASYVGCQANRHFGIAGEPCENPKYLDKLIGIVGGEALSYS